MGRFLVQRDNSAPTAHGTTGSVEYLTKVAKLIPGEIVAAYVTLIGLVDAIGSDGAAAVVKWVLFGIALLCVPLYWYRGIEKSNRSRAILPMAISTIAFLPWSYAVSGMILIPQYYDAAIATILLGVTSLLSGLLPLEEQ